MDELVIIEANKYIKRDINPYTISKINELIQLNDIITLKSILFQRLSFGTAGLRGPMGAGYNKMNELVIIQTTQGIIKYLEEINENNKSVVIGYDHRELDSISSKSMAIVGCNVFLSQGYQVYLLNDLVPTPFVAFAVKYLKCSVGIMVTASHNPKQDNGFKVYWSNGSQIIPPHDLNITRHINENLEPWQLYDYQSTNAIIKTNEVADAYYNELSKLSRCRETNNNNAVKIAYTAMHGVGTRWIVKSFELFNHSPLILVPSQCDPDPTFHTVSYPNPEEKGALSIATSIADLNNCRVVIANDPDADRLAVAEKVDDHWYTFTGNEIGVILGQNEIIKYKSNHPNSSNSYQAAVLASIVSSRMLKSIALTEGFQYYDTLTGFKWLGNKSTELRQSDPPVDVLFSYEEALGYCISDIVADKDGISAAVVLTELINYLYTNNTTIYQHLNDLYTKYGRYVSYNSYLFSYNNATTERIFHNIRYQNSDSLNYKRVYNNTTITSIKDITIGYDSTTIDNQLDLPITPDNQMIMFEFSNGCSVILRTSGTEPKIKYYTEMVYRDTTSSSSDLLFNLISFVAGVIEETLEPQINGLVKP